MIKSNKVYPTSEKITIIEITINNHICHSWYGSPAIIPADIFDAAITTGDTSGKNKIGTKNSVSIMMDLGGPKIRVKLPPNTLNLTIIKNKKYTLSYTKADITIDTKLNFTDIDNNAKIKIDDLNFKKNNFYRYTWPCSFFKYES